MLVMNAVGARPMIASSDQLNASATDSSPSRFSKNDTRAVATRTITMMIVSPAAMVRRSTEPATCFAYQANRRRNGDTKAARASIPRIVTLRGRLAEQAARPEAARNGGSGLDRRAARRRVVGLLERPVAI